MSKQYFITNDLGNGRENKPTSTYCYIPGTIGQARYKGEDNITKAHTWWQYSTDPNNRNELLAAKGAGTKFTVSVGTIGDEAITIKQVGADTTYNLVYPQNGKRTVELKPLDNGSEFTIAHFGHWICSDDQYRDFTPKNLVQAKEATSLKYDTL